MNDLRDQLSGPIRANDIISIKTSALCNNIYKEQLYQSVFDSDTRVAGNALWCLTWFNNKEAKWLIPKRSELVKLALSTDNTTIRRLSLNILNGMPWMKEDVRTDLLDFCIERILLPTEKPGVRTLCIKLAYKQCRYYPELSAELRMVLAELYNQSLCPAIASIHKNILKQLS